MLALLAQHGNDLPPFMVSVCWAACKVIVRDSHCSEKNVDLASGRRNEAAREAPSDGRLRKSWEEDVVSTQESDLTLQHSRTL